MTVAVINRMIDKAARVAHELEAISEIQDSTANQEVIDEGIEIIEKWIDMLQNLRINEEDAEWLQ